MKKIINQYSDLIRSLVVITALITAMLAEDGQSLLLKWFSLSLLWGVALCSLRKTQFYYSIIKDKAFVGYAIFIIWAIFSSVMLSTAKSISIIMLMPFIAGLLSYFIAFSSNEKQQSYFEKLLLILGLLLAVYTSYQLFVLNIHKPAALVSNPNAHATFLGMVFLPWLLRYSLKPVKSKRQTLNISLLCFIFTFAMGLTQSRGALIVIIVSLFFLFVLFYKRRLFYRQSLFFIAALVLGYVATSLFLTDNLVDRLSNTMSVEKISPGRFLIWPAAWQMFLDKPIFGWGIGLFSFLYKQYKPPISTEPGYFAHNDYLQILLELGPIGLLLFLVFVFVLLNRVYFLMGNKQSSSSAYKSESFTFLAVAIGMLAHTFLTFHLYHLTMQILWGYCLGRSAKYFQLAEGEVVNSDQKINKQKFIYYYRGFCSVIALLVICFGLSFYFLQQGDKLKNKQNKLDSYWKAQLFFPLLNQYDSLNASLLTDHLMNLNSRKATIEVREQVANLALIEVNHAISKIPFYVSNYTNKINIYKAMGWDQQLVLNQYENIIKFEPTFFNIRYQYAHELIALKQYDKALEVLWGAWGYWNDATYQIGVEYLSYHLKINEVYGKQYDNMNIEQEIKRLEGLALSTGKSYGRYLFQKKPLNE